MCAYWHTLFYIRATRWLRIIETTLPPHALVKVACGGDVVPGTLLRLCPVKGLQHQHALTVWPSRSRVVFNNLRVCVGCGLKKLRTWAISRWDRALSDGGRINHPSSWSLIDQLHDMLHSMGSLRIRLHDHQQTRPRTS